MNLSQRLDEYLQRHSRIFLLVVIILAITAVIVLLGGFRDVGLVYKAF
jgi:hypothetical protein